MAPSHVFLLKAFLGKGMDYTVGRGKVGFQNKSPINYKRRSCYPSSYRSDLNKNRETGLTSANRDQIQFTKQARVVSTFIS